MSFVCKKIVCKFGVGMFVFIVNERIKNMVEGFGIFNVLKI